MAEKNPIKEIEKIEEKAEEKQPEQERYEVVYVPETLGIRDNKTGDINVLKESKKLEGEVGMALIEALQLNQLWRIEKATGI